MAEEYAVPEGETSEEDAAAEAQPGAEKPPVDWEAKAKAHYAQLKEERVRAEKAEAELQKIKVREQQQKPTPAPAIDWKRAFSLKNEGYSEQEILSLGEMAESTNTPVEKILENPIIKAGIEAARSKAKEAAAVPAPSNRSTLIEGKPIEELTKDNKTFAENFDKIMGKYRRMG